MYSNKLSICLGYQVCMNYHMIKAFPFIFVNSASNLVFLDLLVKHLFHKIFKHINV